MIRDDQVPLFKAVKYVLESWGLGPIRPPATSTAVQPVEIADAVAAEVKFSSTTINGSLSGLVSRSQFEKIVAAMLGPNEKVDVSVIKDDAGELFNTITAHYLLEAFASKINFTLETPRSIAPEDWKIPEGGRNVPGLVQTSIALVHEGSSIILAAEYLKPTLA